MKTFKDYLQEYVSDIPFNPNKLISAMLSDRKKIFDKEITPRQFDTWINTVFKKTKLNFIELEGTTVNSRDLLFPIHIEGEYDEDLEIEEEDQFILLRFEFKSKKIQITEEVWKHLIDELPKIIAHELQHVKQMRVRDFTEPRSTHKIYKGDELKQYLGSDDEIESYALDIATELLQNVGYTKGIQLLKKQNKIRFSDRWNEYIKVFGKNHKVIKTLIKKILIFMDLKKEEQYAK